MTSIRVPGAALLADCASQTFVIPGEKKAKEGFVLRYRGELYAYLNECPHWSVELDLGDGHFFDAALGRIYCKNHGALFVVPSGECETGPCMGRSLEQFELAVEGEDVLVSV